MSKTHSNNYILTLKRALRIAAMEAYQSEVASYEEFMGEDGKAFFAIPMSDWVNAKIDSWIKETEGLL